MTMSSADTIDLCSSPLRPSAKKHRPAPSAVSSSSSRADQETWTCADCTFCNKDCTRNCEVCSADAPSGRERKAKSAAKEKMAVVDDGSEVEEQEDDGDDAWEMGQQQQVDKENKKPDAAPPASVPIKQEVKKEATTGGTKAASIAAAVPSSLSSSRPIAVVDVDGGGGSGGGGAPIEAEWLPHGVVIIRQMVDAAEQELLLEDTVTNCMEGGKQHGYMPNQWFHNFRGNSGLDTGAAAKQQPACIELAANVFTHFRAQHGDAIARRDAAQVDPRLHFPVEFSSDSLFARAYRPASRCAPLYSPLTSGAFALFYLTATHLTTPLLVAYTGAANSGALSGCPLHQDQGGHDNMGGAAGGWVVLLSLGADMEYTLQVRRSSTDYSARHLQQVLSRCSTYSRLTHSSTYSFPLLFSPRTFTRCCSSRRTTRTPPRCCAAPAMPPSSTATWCSTR